MKSLEQFNPHDPKYKKVEDLPEEDRTNFEDVNGGFVRKEAVEELGQANNEAMEHNERMSLIKKLFCKKETGVDVLHGKAIDDNKVFERVKTMKEWAPIMEKDLKEFDELDDLAKESMIKAFSGRSREDILKEYNMQEQAIEQRKIELNEKMLLFQKEIDFYKDSMTAGNFQGNDVGRAQRQISNLEGHLSSAKQEETELPIRLKDLKDKIDNIDVYVQGLRRSAESAVRERVDPNNTGDYDKAENRPFRYLPIKEYVNYKEVYEKLINHTEFINGLFNGDYAVKTEQVTEDYFAGELGKNDDPRLIFIKTRYSVPGIYYAHPGLSEYATPMIRLTRMTGKDRYGDPKNNQDYGYSDLSKFKKSKVFKQEYSSAEEADAVFDLLKKADDIAKRLPLTIDRSDNIKLYSDSRCHIKEKVLADGKIYRKRTEVPTY